MVFPVALPPSAHFHQVIARPAICVSPRQRFERVIAAIVRRVRARTPVRLLAPEPATPPLRCLLGHVAVDVAHWLPNMPRGSEDSKGCSAPVIRAAKPPG